MSSSSSVASPKLLADFLIIDVNQFRTSAMFFLAAFSLKKLK
ncbi:hypothetical protein SynA15127_02659 [Synechococcus sp. A15-127]|nr:hypothetical protein SynA15127_02659 [Synechococcus sp. A15-127]